jgi:FkbM family methyltransferase
VSLSVMSAMRLGRAIHRPIRAALRCAGVPSPVVATRGGVTYELDLDEAIDLGLYLLGVFEPEVTRAIRSIVAPGHVVVDIGANVGAHTLRIAQQVGEAGRVHAFEPTAFAYHKLVRNLALNPALAARVACHRVGLTDGEQALPATISSSWSLTRPLADIHPLDMGFGESTDGARFVSLDRWVAEAGVDRIDAVKLDVDGFEVRVLRGARATLARFRPVLIMEWAPHHYVHAGEPFAAAIEILQALGYRFTTLAGASLAGTPAELERTVPANALRNVIARPT